MSVYDVGFDLHLHRSGPMLESADMPFAVGSIAAIGSGSSSSPSSIAGERIPATEFGEILFHNKQTFTSTANGWRQGIDTDGIYKWVIGGGTSSADWAVTTANTFTITGTIVAAAGFIGGWTIAVGSLYDLTSGTPTAVPNNGVVLDSGDARIVVYEGTAERVRMGFLSAAVYGLRVFATDGTTVIFEASDTRQQFAGWTFTDTILTSVAGGNTTTVSSGATSFLSGPTGAPTFTITQAGAVTATSGTVGGWTLSTTTLTNTAGGNTVTFSTGATAIISGPTGAPTFSVTAAGALTSTSGSIAAFTIAGTTLSATNLVLTSGAANTANITVGTGVTAGGINSAAVAADIIFWGGSTFATRATAPFRVDANGNVFANSIRQAVVTVADTQNFIGTDITQNDVTNNPIGFRVTQNSTGDIINFFDGATETFTILDGGDVGIRNASPDAQLDIISTDTTGDAFQLTANSLTTGTMAAFYSNGTDVSVRNLVDIINDNTLATGAVNLRLQQDSTSSALTISSPGTTTAFVIDMTTANSLTTGGFARYTSNSASVSARNLFTLQNLNTLATGAVCMYLQQVSTQDLLSLDQDGNGRAIFADIENTTAIGVDLICDVLTTGSALRAYSNSSNASARSVLSVVNDHVSAIGAIGIDVQQDAATYALRLTGNGDAIVAYFTSAVAVNTSGILYLFSNAVTTADVINVPNADALTSGRIANFASNSTSTTVRNLVNIVNDNALATGAVCLGMQQDGGNAHMRLIGDPANSSPTDGDIWYNGTRVSMYDGTSVYDLTTRTATGTATRGQASGTGTQAITGAGFRPRAIRIFAIATCANGNTGTSNGFAASVASQSAVAIFQEAPSPPRATAASIIYLITNTSATAARADLQTFDADGFTLNWTTVSDLNLDTDITFQWEAWN